ncbi:hypothetical protein BT96DRAFT_935948 [Gymnopus androsaceus JB14]|uniref:Uncharacterized protein n=1 Tax=Gymnopus androsaceus JB14 TaxID=1447944 RepID=A0A6A4I596_9AGAR|nr:hypothetical protein BT96DRAFT_935948 [Gymnopus androsaceus JB14]
MALSTLTSTAAADVATDVASSTDSATCAVTAAAAAAATTAAATTAADAATTTDAASGQNLQTFTGDVGGSLPPAVTTGERGFVVAGETGDSFLNLSAAIQRSCSIQHNACADAVNSGTGGAGVTVGDCDTQNTQCTAA